MEPEKGARTRRDSLKKIRKTPFVHPTTTSSATSRTRAGTFVQTKDLAWGSRPEKLTGTANTVTRTKLKSGTSMVGSDRTVFFKKLDKAEAPVQYAVASTRLARFLGMPEVIAHNAFARIKGVDGVVSGRVPGKPLLTFEFDTRRPVPKELSAQEIPDWARSLQLTKRKGGYFARSAALSQWVDYADPRIQKGLSDLQLFDAISGQADRHAGNIYVDQGTGAVTGIDDDQSFGRGQSADDVVGDTKRAQYRGLPDLVDATTADRILALNASGLRSELAPRQNDPASLTAHEIDDAVTRLRTVQAYLRTLKDQGRLVTTWDPATYQQEAQNVTGSYLGRQVHDLADAATGRIMDADTDTPMALRVVGAPTTTTGPTTTTTAPTTGPTTTTTAPPPVTSPPPPQPTPAQPQPQPGWTAQQRRPGVPGGPGMLAQSRTAPLPLLPTLSTTSGPALASARAAAAARSRARFGQVSPLPAIGDEADSSESGGRVSLSGDDRSIAPGVSSQIDAMMADEESSHSTETPDRTGEPDESADSGDDHPTFEKVQLSRDDSVDDD